ncbi:amylo-alpha-1,6-glucosidase [Microcoleus sp. LEGE 07076]|uniref:amylo-alpha-1,6-glucosidase n=1 Tax=Microcoleus sp. LEGE 07076 TaxID=915322 RepID=UPI0018827E96|nr:amylo-alpha-1,6-glucosidase [Microcoleus sp. LEGE 07076]MBE9187221.1 amylo-alpha-1,6-glucosidase [Microcoleus sp. LEGE 07076]
MTDTVELEGKTFVAAAESPVTEWPCAIADRPQPTLTLKDDDLFLIIDTLGNISGCLEDDSVASLGLFCHDTRFLSRLELQIEGRSPILLSSNAEKGYLQTVLCSNPRIDDRIRAETIGIKREMVLSGGLFEEIEITNFNTKPVSFEISLSFNSDFLDLFEVRGYGRSQRGQILRLVPQKTNGTSPGEADKPAAPVAGANGNRETENPATENPNPPIPASGKNPIERKSIDQYPACNLQDNLTLAYQGLDGLVMESRIDFYNQPPALFQGNTALWRISLESHQAIKLGYRLKMLTDGKPISTVSTPVNLTQAKAAELLEEREWLSKITRINSDKNTFNRLLKSAEQDIYSLRQTFGEGKAISAGVPWFSTLFGRDSIIAASQILILDPTLARETLTTLAHYQGKTDDDWRDEEPGKILHEIRLGEMARCHEIPHTPYYGTVDATPLWLMLYAEYYAWTYDSETLDSLWPNALAAMEWIDRKCAETGYLSYYQKSQRGLANQGWKDSGDCIVNRYGVIAEGAIALCEVQAYVYAAKLRLAEIARIKKRIDLVDRWKAEAENLKTRFNRDFWIEDLDYCALALDGQGKPADSISSNPGHCLHLGILSPEKAQSVAERLQAPDMFSGWGIRTLSSKSPAYNPIGYHTGSVWPHDNALTALGLRSIGRVEQALEVAEGLFDMTLLQPYERPPELFCGYERNNPSDLPVQYPVACSPQAWATGSMFQLLQMMLNLVPDAPNNQLRIIDPALPESIDKLSLHNLRIGSTVLDLEFEGSGSSTACRVIKKRGNLRVIIEA